MITCKDLDCLTPCPILNPDQCMTLAKINKQDMEESKSRLIKEATELMEVK